MPPRRPREDGIALLLVLWVMALLTVVGFSLARGVDTRAKIDRNQYDLARAQALADTGVSLAVLGVLGSLPGGRWRLDGSPREPANADGTLVVRAQSEAGKIDLNHAGADLLANLFRTTGVDGDAAEALAIAIADWENHRRAQWRQRAEETANGSSIGVVQPFLAVEELREIPGLTREIYDRVSPYLTIYSGVARVDPLTAPREVLLSLPGADAREVDTYVAARAEIGPDPALLPPLDGVGSYLRSGLPAYVSITSEAQVSQRARFVREATVSLLEGGAGRFRFVTWQRGQQVRNREE